MAAEMILTAIDPRPNTPTSFTFLTEQIPIGWYDFDTSANTTETKLLDRADQVEYVGARAPVLVLTGAYNNIERDYAGSPFEALHLWEQDGTLVNITVWNQIPASFRTNWIIKNVKETARSQAKVIRGRANAVNWRIRMVRQE